MTLDDLWFMFSVGLGVVVLIIAVGGLSRLGDMRSICDSVFQGDSIYSVSMDNSGLEQGYIRCSRGGESKIVELESGFFQVELKRIVEEEVE